jgi:hypothetical protein
MVTAVNIAILPPEPVRGLAIKLSKKLNTGDFCLNETDILPHITLAIGFVENVEVAKKKIAQIMQNFEPLQLIVERMEGRYLIVKKGAEMEKLHRQITVQTDFIKPESIEKAYFTKPGEEISQQTKEYTNSFKRENSFGNWIPHITIGWDDEADTSKLKARFPQKFTVGEIAICQLGNNNTCRKVLYSIPLGN